MGGYVGGRSPNTKRGDDMIQLFRGFSKSETGATAIEYGLIAAGIAVAIIAAVGILGDSLSTLFSTLGSELSGGGNNDT